MGDEVAEVHPNGQAAAAGREDSGAALWRVALRRRRFIIDPGYQLRASFIAVGVAVLLLVLLNVSLFVGDEAHGNASAGSSGIEFGLVAVGSLVFLAGVFLVSVLETHRTSGAALRIGRAMEKIRWGRLDTRIRLRRGDNLQELANAFNTMSKALHERSWDEIAAIEDAADRIEGAAGNPEALVEAIHGLRRIAHDRRQSLT